MKNLQRFKCRLGYVKASPVIFSNYKVVRRQCIGVGIFIDIFLDQLFFSTNTNIFFLIYLYYFLTVI